SYGLVKITYPGIGTFTDVDFYDPKWRPFVAIPQSPEEIRAIFLLENRKNQFTPYRFLYNEFEKIRSSPFDPKLRTKIIVHGFIDSSSSGHWMRDVKDKYLEIEDTNVIICDWSRANFFPYTVATANTRVVGPMIGIVIQQLCKFFNVTEDSFHIIGHSLGSHIAGYAGKFLNGKLGEITGLDPAGPYYEGLKDTRARLWHTDALFVQSIHTDATHLLESFGFGTYETFSHIDIYPNGGRTQPGCDQERSTAIQTEGLLYGVRRLIMCNHQRAIEFFKESMIDPESTPFAYACDSFEAFDRGECSECGLDGSRCTILGMMAQKYRSFIKNPDQTIGRRYFLTTSPHNIFFKFQYLVRIKTSKTNPFNIMGRILLKFVNFYDDQKSDAHFNQKDEKFLSSTSYQHVLVTDINPNDLNSIVFKWTHGWTLFKKRIFIENIEVVPLSTRSGFIRSSQHELFETEKSNGIVNDEEVVFDRESVIQERRSKRNNLA
ncbi:Pancreatic triacylglycerol lipase, partial [Sarcoptes scabiei]